MPLHDRSAKRSVAPTAATDGLADEQLEQVAAWGKTTVTVSHVFRPTCADEIAAVFDLARANNLTVGLRGGGNSYGDAACNSQGLVLDLTRMKRILAWNAKTGVITVEPGVRLRELWEYVIEDGWWPPVSTGTMYITIGGGTAMNVHGKNAYNTGPIGDHILAFELLLANGETIECSRDQNSDIFFAAIGGFGMLGCFTSITLQLKRIYSGLLDVRVLTSANLGEMFAQFGTLLPHSDYLVGWIDTSAGVRHLGRGQIHQANYLAAGADPYPQQTLRVQAQHLNDTLFGIVPRSAMWRFMRPFFNRFGVPLVNRAKYHVSRLHNDSRVRQPHAQFHFLLNYFPNWQRATGSGGLIQYQPFVPASQAQSVFGHLLHLSQQRGLVPYLGVLKRHRPDRFLMTHGLDGYSLALDYQVTEANRSRLAALCREMDAVVLAAGGRFYPAKDSVLRPEVARAYLGDDVITQFRYLKQRCDPDDLLQTNFWRRVFDAPAPA